MTEVQIGRCRLIHGDCTTVMPQLAASGARFAAIVTDPPYGDTSLPWDAPVHGWPLLAVPLLRPAGSLWFFTSMRYLLAEAATLAQADLHFAQDLVWEKHNGSSFLADRFRRVHELLVHYYVGEWSDLPHNTQYTNDATARTVRHKARAAHFGHIEADTYKSHDGGPRMQRSVIYHRSEHGRAIHGTQKPVEMCAIPIRYSSNPNDHILDPFAGSGSTGAAAIREERQWTGIESDPKAFASAAQRLKSFAGHGSLFA